MGIYVNAQQNESYMSFYLLPKQHLGFMADKSSTIPSHKV